MVSLLPIILVVFVLASLFRIAFIYHVLYVLLAVLVLARLWSAAVARRLRVDRAFPERGLFGETVTVELTLTNESPLPVPWVRIHDRLPVELAAAALFERALSLGPRGRASFTYQLHCRQRGWYELGPATVETGDVMGFDRRRREFSSDRRLLVYPKILSPAALGLASRTPFGDVRTRQPLYEDPARVSGVRDYQPGDSLRRINWRSSAATGRLQVRKLEPAMTLRTIVALDLDVAAYERSRSHYATELAIVVAASLIADLIDRRQEVGLLSNGVDRATGTPIDLAPRKGRPQLTRLLDALARVEAYAGEPLEARVGAAMGDLSWGATVVLITGRATDAVRRLVGRLRRAGFAVVVVLVTQVSAYGDGMAALGAPIHYVWRESDIDDVGDAGPRRRPTRLAAG